MRKQVSKGLRFDIFNRDAFTCQYCGRTPPEVMLHVDHVVPVAKGGTNDPENLTTSCAGCNGGKSAKSIGATSNPVDKARRAQEALEAVAFARHFAKAAKARDKVRERAAHEICFHTERERCRKASVTSLVMAAETFGAESAFLTLDRAAIAVTRSGDTDEENLMRYFNAVARNMAKEAKEGVQ